MIADLAADLDGEPLLPSHASAMGSHSSAEASPASPQPAQTRSSEAQDSTDSRPIKWRDRATVSERDTTAREGDTGAATMPVSRPASAVSRKLAEGEVDPAAPTERLRLGPDGTLLR